VNFATGRASVSYPATLDPGELIATVEATGYTARLPEPSVEADPLPRLRTRLLVSLVLAVPVVALAMVPMLRFPGWQWLGAILATPVVAYGGWPFHRAAWTNLRHGAATGLTTSAVPAN